MIRIAAAAALVAGLTLAASPLKAESATPDGENGRYTFHQVGDGVLRLDTRTGQVSHCSQRAAGWTCQAVPSERAALESEIARVQGENAALKRAMLARGLPLPSEIKPEAGRFEPKIELKLPSDEDIDRVMTFLEKLWRRLIDMVQSVQRDMDRKG